MSRMSPGVLMMMLGGVLLVSSTALAQPIIAQRCNADSLNPVQAEARLRWMRKCALTKAPPIWTPAPAGALQEYEEASTGPGMYTTDMYAHEINASVIINLYHTALMTQALDPLGFYEWFRPAARRKARPLYPTYGSHYSIHDAANQQLFPHPTLASCNFYFDRNGTQPAPATQSFFPNGFCEANLTLMTSGVPLTVAGDMGSAQNYLLSVPAGATQVVFELSGGTGDADIYVRYGTPPETSAYDCRPYRSGNAETCTMPAPAAGSWYVMVRGYQAYAGVTLKGTVY